MRQWIWVFALCAPSVAVAGKMDKLSQEEVDTFHALVPFMSDDQEKMYLKLKSADERTALLKEATLVGGSEAARNLYELWYRFDAETRTAITAGDVKPGWTQDMMFMAWGEPFNRNRLTGRNATRSELFQYRFEVAEDGAVLVWVPKSKASYKAVDAFQLDVYVDDGRISDIVKKDDWE